MSVARLLRTSHHDASPWKQGQGFRRPERERTCRREPDIRCWASASHPAPPSGSVTVSAAAARPAELRRNRGADAGSTVWERERSKGGSGGSRAWRRRRPAIRRSQRCRTESADRSYEELFSISCRRPKRGDVELRIAPQVVGGFPTDGSAD